MWPTDGESLVLGGEFGAANLLELRRSIRLVQPAGPYDIDTNLTAREVVLTGFFGSLGLYDPTTPEMQAEAEQLLGQVGLAELSDHAYATLSSGERIRSLIARALVRRPRLLLLDEPTAGLDVLAREQVLATIESLFHNGRTPPTIVLITHHVEELPPATSRVLLLREGRAVAAGTPGETLRGPILSEVYGCPVQVRRSNGRHYLEVHPGAWEKLLSQADEE
jgi:iron complex transport system ATP-binding protein